MFVLIHLVPWTRLSCVFSLLWFDPKLLGLLRIYGLLFIVSTRTFRVSIKAHLGPVGYHFKLPKQFKVAVNQHVRNPANLKCNNFLRANGSMFFRNCSLSSLFDGSCSIIGYHFKLGKPVNKAVAKKSKGEKPCRSQMQLFPQSEWLNVFRNCSLSSLFDGSCSIIGYHFKLGKPVNKAVAKKSKCEKPCRS